MEGRPQRVHSTARSPTEERCKYHLIGVLKESARKLQALYPKEREKRTEQLPAEEGKSTEHPARLTELEEHFTCQHLERRIEALHSFSEGF